MPRLSGMPRSEDGPDGPYGPYGIVEVDRCARSTLCLAEDGMTLFRKYADTDRTSAPFALTVDAAGHRRCSGNRNVDALLARTSTYRGVDAPSRPAPAHLRNALRALCRAPREIEVLARMLGVAPNTAWSYACGVVEYWPASHVHARALLDPDLAAAVDACADRSGSLRELMARLPARATAALRERVDRYAFLRLARLCAEARGTK